ncbi:hypothetical protein [Pumilibacter intestinalis]|nr:hypothetical protein [Pumilibacter intestinalis]
MEKSFMLNIVTPDREFFSGNIESLIIGEQELKQYLKFVCAHCPH